VKVTTLLIEKRYFFNKKPMEQPPQQKKKRGRKNMASMSSQSLESLTEDIAELDEHEEILIAHIPLSEEGGDEHEDGEDAKNLIMRLKKENEMLQKANDYLMEKVNAVGDVGMETVLKTPLPHHRIDEMKPQQPGLLCWWCSHSFSNPPVFLPHWKTDDVYHVSGYFCGFSCCLSYSYSLKDSLVIDRHVLLNQIHGKCGRGRITPAPPRELLDIYGGPLGIDLFRKKEMRVLMPPMKSIMYSVETNIRDTCTFEKPTPDIVIPLNTKDVAKAKQSLKLKRNKPKKSNTISIMETMGLISKSSASKLESGSGPGPGLGPGGVL